MATYAWDKFQDEKTISKREIKRKDKTELDNYLFRLYRKLKQIRFAQHNLGFEEINPPIQRGWKRTFVLNPIVKQSKESEFFQTLLDKINTERINNRKDFKKMKKRKGKKVRVEIPQYLEVLSEYWYRKKIQTEKEQAYFEEVLVYSKHKTLLYKEYHFKEKWRFKLKIVPNWIRFAKIIDPLLLQQKAEIEAYLEKNNLSDRMYKLKNGSYGYKDKWNPKPKEKYAYLENQNSYKKYLEEFLEKKRK